MSFLRSRSVARILVLTMLSAIVSSVVSFLWLKVSRLFSMLMMVSMIVFVVVKRCGLYVAW